MGNLPCLSVLMLFDETASSRRSVRLRQLSQDHLLELDCFRP